MGRTTEAIAAFQEALPLYRRAGNREGEIKVLIGLGDRMAFVGEVDRGLSCYEQAESLARTATMFPKSQRARWDASICMGKGNCHLRAGRHAEALTFFTQHLELDKRLPGGDSAVLAVAMMNIASAQAALGRPELAVASYKGAIDRMERRGLTNSESFAMAEVNLGCVLLGVGSPKLALRHMERGFAIYRSVLPPSHPSIADTMKNVARAQVALGNFGGATELFKAGVSLGRRSQTQCSGPDCKRTMRHDGEPLDVCVMCRVTFYCSKACQTADWKAEGGHKAECKALIAEAEGAEGAAACAAASGGDGGAGSGVETGGGGSSLCAAAGCSHTSTPAGEPLTVCLGCGVAAYCSVDCQRAAWRAGHKAECKTMKEREVV